MMTIKQTNKEIMKESALSWWRQASTIKAIMRARISTDTIKKGTNFKNNWRLEIGWYKPRLISGTWGDLSRVVVVGALFSIVIFLF